jgi:hypothetical protein
LPCAAALELVSLALPLATPFGVRWACGCGVAGVVCVEGFFACPGGVEDSAGLTDAVWCDVVDAETVA